MASHLMRRAAEVLPRLATRCSSAAATVPPEAWEAKPLDQLSQAHKDEFYPSIGNRDIVGYGWNGIPSYVDRADFPMPSIRFGENTPAVMALREKELGDWKNLTIEEKKSLYRASFCQTFAEVDAPTGEWKNILALTLASLLISGWVMIWINSYVYSPRPESFSPEWIEKSVEHMIRQGQGPIQGISAKWDYEKNTWKK